MKNAKLFHGRGCTPDSYWYPYIAQELTEKGFDVRVPQLPDSDFPTLDKWLPVAMAQGEYNNDTVIIGHSSGGPLLLSILERIDVQIAKAVLVAGFARQRPGIKEKDFLVQDTYDWTKIRNAVRELCFINSDNDPWGCNDHEGRWMFDRLGGTLIINHEGHMGSDFYKQPYKEFPFLVKLLL